MNKLWIIGDSFFTRCTSMETRERSAGGSWTEHFAKNLDMSPEYYWAYGSLSNQSLLLGLDCVYDHPRFNINTDKVLCGFTATSRQIVQGHHNAPRFDRARGLRNEVEGSIVGTTFLDQKQFPMGMANAEKLLDHNRSMHTPAIKRLVQQWYETLYPIDFDEYLQCMTIDGAITRAKQRGIDIIPHSGFMDYPYWGTDDSVEHKFDWLNKEMFTAPSFNSMYTHAVEEEKQFVAWSNHMSPDAAKIYADKYTEHYNAR